MDNVDTQEYTHWVAMFLSPTLLDVELGYYGASWGLGLDCSTALDLLEEISLRCPSLRRLRFYPREDVNDFEFGTRAAIVSQQRLDMLASFRLQLSSFRDLRTLESSVLVLRPGILSALGELPHLETLLINGNDREPRILDLTLPVSSFPSLRNLGLWNFHSANLRYLSEFSPLLRQLTKLAMYLTYSCTYHYRWEVDAEWDWQSKLMLGVAKNAPLLTDLAIDFDLIGAQVCLSSEWADVLQLLPLRRLSIQNAEFERDWSHLALAMPSLEVLQGRCLRFNEIFELARGLPRLRLLELKLIDLESFVKDGEYEEYDNDQEDDSNVELAATRTSKKRTAVEFSGADLQLKAVYRGLPATKRRI